MGFLFKKLSPGTTYSDRLCAVGGTATNLAISGSITLSFATMQ